MSAPEKTPLSAPQRVAVISIGRSGTSLLARILHEVVGVDFGEEKDHIPRNHNNPDGYFENRELLECNERILADIGGAVLSPPPLDFLAHLSVQTRAQRVAELREKLSAYSHGKPHFGWKDPRLSLTYPIWKLADPTIIPIIIFRDPEAVYRSIAAQLSTDPEKLGDLWTEYYRRIFAYTADSRRLVLSFRQMVDSPLSLVGTIAAHLGIPAEPAAWEQKLAGIVKPSQIHHAPAEGAARPAFIDAQTQALFNYLSQTLDQGRQPNQNGLQPFFKP